MLFSYFDLSACCQGLDWDESFFFLYYSGVDKNIPNSVQRSSTEGISLCSKGAYPIDPYVIFPAPFRLYVVNVSSSDRSDTVV